MSHFRKFPKSTLRFLADHIGEKLSAESAALAKPGKVELAETFEVWFLGRAAILRPDAPLSELAQRTGYWHHQIRQNGKAKEYALSRTFGPGVHDWEIRAIMSSSVLPDEIDKAIHWIDKKDVERDPLACLLSIPAYHMTAFWLRGKNADRIVIVDQPDSFEHLKKKRLYGEPEFLRSLALERHAQGIPDPIPQFIVPDNIPAASQVRNSVQSGRHRGRRRKN